MDKKTLLKKAKSSTFSTFGNSDSSCLENNRLAQGEKFASYIVQKKLGQGGMGEVYCVFDPKLFRYVALKMILSTKGLTETQIQRFLEEARSTATLNHPNIVGVYEIGNHPENYFTMEYIKGNPLSSLLQKKHFTPEKIAEILIPCCEAIHYAHKNGIIHRDIKPSNIMMEENTHPKIMDFGLAKNIANDNNLSKTKEMMGTPVYMPPEQAEGRMVDARSDIYSLGATLYEMLCLRPPFQGENIYVLLKQIFYDDPIEPRTLNPDIPIDIEAICLKCLDKKPSKRYQSARDLAGDLENFLSNRPIQAIPVTNYLRFRKWVIRNKAIVSIVFASALFVSFLVGLFVWQTFQNAKTQKKRLSQTIQSIQQEQEAKEAAIEAKKKSTRLIEKTRELKAKQRKLRQKVEKSAYRSNIILVDKLNDDGQSEDAHLILSQCPEEQREWEWFWQKYRAQNPKEKTPKVIPLNSVSSFAVFTPNGKQVAVSPRYELGVLVLDCDTAEVRQEIRGHRSFISAFQYNGKGNRFVTTGPDIRMFIWDTLTLKKRKSFHLSFPAYAADSYSSTNHDLVCISGKNGQVILLDMKSEKLIRTYDLRPSGSSKNAHHIREVFFQCDFNHNGKIIVLQSYYGSYLHLMQWETNREKILKLPKRSQGFSCHPHRDLIAVALGNELLLYDMKSSKPIRKFVGHSGLIRSCDFSPDGKRLVSGGEDHMVCIWETEGEEVQTPLLILKKHKGAVLHCSFSKQGDKIVTTSIDQSVCIWNAPN